MAFPTQSVNTRSGGDTLAQAFAKVNAHFSDASQHSPSGGSGITGMVSATSLGIDPTNSAAANRAAFNALDNNTNFIYFKPGNYAFDNSAGWTTIDNFSGTMYFVGEARIVLQDPSHAGINFAGGTGATLFGLNIAYNGTNPATLYGVEHSIQITSATDTYVENYSTAGSPGFGILFLECIRPTINNAYIHHTAADGLHFSNCVEPQAVNILCEDTADDAIAFLNNTSQADNSGGKATNCVTKRSGSRGITVVGQRGVHVSNFYVEDTNGAGIEVVHDEVTDTRTPTDTIFSSGTIVRGGAYVGSTRSRSGVQMGISVRYHTDPAPSANFRATFDNIDVIDASLEGIYSRTNAGVLSFNNIRVRGAGEFGMLHCGARVQTNNLVVEETQLAGVAIVNCLMWEFSNVRVRNASKGDPNGRAVLVENGYSDVEGVTAPTTALVHGQGLMVLDNQGAPSGYQVTCAANSGFAIDGEMGIITYFFSNAIPAPPWGGENETVIAERRYVGAQRSLRSTVPSTTAHGRFVAGDRIKCSAPAALTPSGWVCVTSGNPGTFKAEAYLGA
jgi:hypothetical protein